jgi:hypothetical protein
VRKNKKILNTLLGILVVTNLMVLSSCNQTSPTPTNPVSDFLNVVVAGSTYNQTMLTGIHAQLGGSQNSSCDSKKYVKEQMTSVSPSNFNLLASIKFYQSDSVFNNNSMAGIYAVGNDQAWPEMTCNLTLLVSYYDNATGLFATLVSGGKNTITSITKGTAYSTYQEYIVQGNFNCSWISNGTTIPCTGTYQKTISVNTP